MRRSACTYAIWVFRQAACTAHMYLPVSRPMQEINLWRFLLLSTLGWWTWKKWVADSFVKRIESTDGFLPYARIENETSSFLTIILHI